MIRKLQHLKSKKGFTLVELIVVIAIIGVLAAILVPLMGNYLESARITSADSTAKGIQNRLTAFMQQEGLKNRGMKGAATEVITAVWDDTNGNFTISGFEGSSDYTNWNGYDFAADELEAFFNAEIIGALPTARNCSFVWVVSSNTCLYSAYISATYDDEELVTIVGEGSDQAGNAVICIDENSVLNGKGSEEATTEISAALKGAIIGTSPPTTSKIITDTSYGAFSRT